MSKETDLAWLAGIIDGEGTISFGVSTRHGGRLCIVPLITVVNSDEAILRETSRILNVLVADAGTVDRQNHRTGVASFKGTKACYAIRVASSAAEPVLLAVMPYLVCQYKRTAAEAVLAFIKYRRENLLQRDKRGRVTRVGYPKHLVELVASVRSHKSAKPLSEMLKAPNITH